MKQYLEILEDVLTNGTWKKPARDNMPRTISRFGVQKRFNLADGFPLVTTKKMYTKGIIHELLWFLKGDTNIKYLIDNDVNIWNEDGYKWYCKQIVKRGINPLPMDAWIQYIKTYNENPSIHGELGKIYSYQWRQFNAKTSIGDIDSMYTSHAIDQIQNMIDGIKSNPESRYHIVTAWNPSEVYDAALPPCHVLFQFNCREITLTDRIAMLNPMIETKTITSSLDATWETLCKLNHIPTHRLDCQLYQRSADTPLGVPFNIASYALLTIIIAKLTNTVPGEFIWTGGDVHIYENQIDTVKVQLTRTPMKLPTINIKGTWNNIDDIKYEDFELVGYESHPKLVYPLSTGLIK